jgi:hypothetical protein
MENKYLSVSYDFSRLIGLGKSRCDILNGSSKDVFAQYSIDILGVIKYFQLPFM